MRGRAFLAAAIVAAAAGAAGEAQAGQPIRALTGFDRGAVDRARAGALRRLQAAECRRLFTDFRDAQGRTLQQNLEEWTVDPSEYVALVPFLDGSREPSLHVL